MCLIVFAWQVHPDYPLILAANRDEFHRRPARRLHWWPDMPEIAGGRDLQAGGTWLAANRQGRFATVTNYRENLQVQPGERSRGSLVVDFLAGDLPPLDYASSLDGARFAGFSLLAGTPASLVYVSNRGDSPRPLATGIYGLSNASLDTPWPKLVRSKQRLAALLDADRLSVGALFELLGDRDPAGAGDAPGGDLPEAAARAVSAPFIVTPTFGTRCSSVLLSGSDGRIRIHERRFDAAGTRRGDSSLDFPLSGSAAG